MLERLGRKNSIMIGFVVVITSTVGIGLTQHIRDDKIFLIVSICARFFQGMGDMWVQTSCNPPLQLNLFRLLSDDL